jgi:hypothetical protein
MHSKKWSKKGRAKARANQLPRLGQQAGKAGQDLPLWPIPPLPLTTAAAIAVVASRFAREERFEVVFGDQSAASCLYGPELAGAQ